MMLLTLQLLHNLVGLLGHLLVYILALLVILVDVVCLGKRLLEIAFHKQIDSLGTVLHTS